MKIDIVFANPLQVKIADLMWNADSFDEVQRITSDYGKDGRIVYEMMMAEIFDGEDGTDLAQDVLSKF